jgi:hypothetical protein
MNTAASNNRFLIDVFSFKRWAELQRAISPGEFYQHLASELIKGIHTKEALSQLGNNLINLAEYAYSLRQMDTLEQISHLLPNLPLAREFRIIARYFQAYCIKRRGQFNEARSLFVKVADESPLRYRARAMAALGTIAFDSGEFQSALPFYIEASKAAIHRQGFDLLAAFYTQHMMAVLRSIDGDDRGALADLERMFPLVRAVGSVYPPIYCNYLNSLAVELAEAGRLEEATQACRITLASPFANSYPEYRATSDDIALRGRRASRSFVSFAQRALETENVLHLPVPDHSTGLVDSCLEMTGQPARVLDYINWKKKMGKKPNGDQKNDDEMDDRDVFMEIMRLSSQPGMTSKKLWQILEAVRKVTSEPDKD